MRSTTPIRLSSFIPLIPALAALLVVPTAGMAEDASGFSGADTAWILTSTALVLFMTLPGLALFHAGLVRAQNVLPVLTHCFAICCVASVLWLVIGYSLAFNEGNAWIGGLGLAEGVSAAGQFGVQVIALLAVAVWTAILTFIIIKLVGALVGLRVSEEVEIEGLDITIHGERGYEL